MCDGKDDVDVIIIKRGRFLTNDNGSVISEIDGDSLHTRDHDGFRIGPIKRFVHGLTPGIQRKNRSRQPLDSACHRGANPG